MGNANSGRQKPADMAKARQLFLNAFIDTQSVKEAAIEAGISEGTAYRWSKKYANMIEAQFDTLGLSREVVMGKHKEMIETAPTRLKVTKQGVFREVDAAAHLKAIELYYEVAGIKKSTPEVVVVNDINTELHIETEVFKTVPEEVKKAIRDKLALARKEGVK